MREAEVVSKPFDGNSSLSEAEVLREASDGSKGWCEAFDGSKGLSET